MTGTLVGKPYPRLLVDGDAGIREILPVRGGKNGVPTVEAEQAGRLHVAKGGIYRRDGRELMEVYGPLAMVEGEALTLRQPISRSKVTLNGVIVDSKCYYGRMKPGAGQAHRACAQYCVWSGIPPVLVAYADDGRHEHYLLTRRDGAPRKERCWSISPRRSR